MTELLESPRETWDTRNRGLQDWHSFAKKVVQIIVHHEGHVLYLASSRKEEKGASCGNYAIAGCQLSSLYNFSSLFAGFDICTARNKSQLSKADMLSE